MLVIKGGVSTTTQVTAYCDVPTRHTPVAGADTTVDLGTDVLLHHKLSEATAMNTEALQEVRVLHILQKISSKHSPLSGRKYISAVYYNIGQVQM